MPWFPLRSDVQACKACKSAVYLVSDHRGSNPRLGISLPTAANGARTSANACQRLSVMRGAIPPETGFPCSGVPGRSTVHVRDRSGMPGRSTVHVRSYPGVRTATGDR